MTRILVDDLTGPPGASAYEVAVSNGFVGSELEWLESLNGEDGSPGEPGPSAYDEAVSFGYVGTKDSWLNSLKGEKGDPGSAGIQGLKGDPGERGIQGIQGNPGVKGDTGNQGFSAYELAVQGGYSGSQTNWLIGLKGDKGDRGAPTTIIGSEFVKVDTTNPENPIVSVPALAYVQDVYISVASLGCTPNVDVNQAVADENTALINAALDVGNVFFPQGLWVVVGLLVPSDRKIDGAGMKQAVIKTISGTSSNTPTITNKNNTNESRTNYNSNIEIRNVTINGNGGNRDGSPDINGNGAALKLATVRDCLVERCNPYNGHSHSIDISASTYQDNAVALNAPNKRPAGPSHSVIVRDCVVGGSYDDAITTHDSHDLTIENNSIVNHESTPRTGHSNGIEVDDGSWNVDVVGNYIRGFSSGIAVKGHDPSIPARNVNLKRNSVEWCRYGFWLFWDNWEASPELPRAVTIDDCRITNLGDVFGDYDEGLGYVYHPAILISAYSNVKINNFVMYDSPSSDIMVRNGASDVVIDGVDSTDCWTTPYSPHYRGLITVLGGAGDGVEVRHVRVRGWKSPGMIVYIATENSCLVEDIRVTGTDSPVWAAYQQYEIGDSVTVGSMRFLALEAGTTSGTAPSLNMGSAGYDGTVKWIRLRSAAVETTGYSDKKVARRIISPGHRFLSSDRGTDTHLTTQPPVTAGWWVSQTVSV